MNARIRRAGAAIGATLVILGSLAAPAAGSTLAASAQAAVQRSSFGLVDASGGRRYATTSVAGSDKAFAAHTSRPPTGLTPTRPAGVTAPSSGGLVARPLVAPAPVQATTTGAPDNHAAGFSGLGETDQPTPGAEPAQSSVAAGPDQVMQFANAEVRVTNRDGTGPLTRTVAGFFFLPTGFFDSSPRVVYDSLHGRFVATETSWDCMTGTYPGDPAAFGHGYVDLAVSRTTDPTGLWDLYFWAYNDLVPLDPSIGSSTDKLAISDNLSAMAHGDGGHGDGSCGDPASLTPATGDIQVANWSDAVAHKTDSLPSAEYAGASVFGVRAALQEPATSATLYVIARSVASDGMGTNVDDVIVTAFSGTTTATSSVQVTGSWNLTENGITAPFADPPAPHQPGAPATIVDATNGDAEDAIWQSGLLTWATTYPCTPSGDSSQRDCVRVTQLDTSVATVDTPPSEAQDFLLARNGFDSYVPGIAFSGDGTLEIAYTRSNATAPNYPTSYQQYQRAAAHGSPADPPNSASPAVQLAAGTSTYGGLDWGPFSGLAPDPQVPSGVWQAGAYGGAAASWATFVDLLGATVGTTYVPITPVRILDSRDGSGLSGVTGKFKSSVPRTFGVAGLGSIPTNAVAVTGNLTVTRQASGGFVSLTPNPQVAPTSSTVNFPVGDNRANNVTASLSAAGTLAATFVGQSSAKTTDLVFDVTGYFVADDSAATYHPVAPTRLIDSRVGIGQPPAMGTTGPGIPAKFHTGVPQTFTNSSVDGFNGSNDFIIPAAATAITGNLTVTRQTSSGFLSITPDPTAAPTVSNLNFPIRDNRANGFTAPFNASHQFSIVYLGAAGSTADVIIDVTGYYLDDLTGLHFYPVNPGRIMDTRTGTANSGLTGAFTSAVPRELDTAGHWAMATDAQAVTGNLTVTGQTAGGYASITSVSDPNPATSTLNFPVGENRANGVTVPLSGAGSLWLVYRASPGKTTNLILDVSGYFR